MTAGGGVPQGGAVYTERTPRVVAARKLTRRSGRQRAGRFLAEGSQAVREALAWARSGAGVVYEVFTVDAAHELARQASIDGVAVSVVTEQAFRGLSETVTPQGIAAVCDLVDRPLDSALPGGGSAAATLLAVGVGTADPGNAGTLVRVADAVGAAAVVFTTGSVDPHNGKAVRASAGSLFHVPVVRDVEPGALVERCREASVRLLATAGSASRSVFEADLTGPVALLFGSEAHGLAATVEDAVDEAVRVPIYGAAESLNLGTAAAVCLYAAAAAHRASSTRPSGEHPDTASGAPAPIT